VFQNTLPNGGVRAFADQSTVATWLSAAGYRTGFYGKYLNEYDLLGNYIPPGWREWHVFDSSNGEFYDYNLNVNGTYVYYGTSPQDYSTDVLTARGVQFIESTPAGQPFFLFHAIYPPHEPFTPAPQDIGTFAGQPDWRPPAYNEADVSDKPAWVRALPLVSPSAEANLDAINRQQLESLQAADRGVQALFAALARSGRLDNTLVIFTSDNGLSWGEHRWFLSKNCVYEECIRVPFWVRRPGQTPRTDSSLVQNIDLAPTLADWAGVVPPGALNGSSLLPLMQNAAAPWRSESLVETRGLSAARDYQAVRTLQYVYAEYANGDRELYDLTVDPHQLTNVVHDPAYAVVLPALQAALAMLKSK
jgi:arylsulfatase A-like enzyme